MYKIQVIIHVLSYDTPCIIQTPVSARSQSQPEASLSPRPVSARGQSQPEASLSLGPVSARGQSQQEASLSLGLSEPEASLRLRSASLSTRPVSARGQFQPEASLGTRSALAGGQSLRSPIL